ncbi:MAG TPA: DUF695 domain-containing protein [Flavisolibacter sp.]|nr:DUF695 domain-containing protein [Flavisolibacter sp.]
MKSEQATYTGFEFEVDGFPAIAIINADLKALQNKQAFSHSVFITVIPDVYNENGHPEEAEYDHLNEIEKSIINYLEEQTASVHVGHTTLYRAREIIFYTGQPEVVENFLEHFLQAIERESSFDIEEDREWSNVSAFYELL